MAAVSPVEREFLRRLERIPAHGLGLSVDLYSPDLASLRRVLQERQVLPAYLEVFRAVPAALDAVRQQVGDGLLTYHGEGLWLTQPEAADDPLFGKEVREVAEHLRLLQSAWLNHECATKYMAGYAYGTYLPPLYTESSAAVVADNTRLIQNLLDRHGRLLNGDTPLVLLEMAPLTYFATGTLSIPEFFRLVTERVSCGLVLDVGHLWTVFRYTGGWRTTSLGQFVEAFLSEFPLERVVEIHVAGLAVHASSTAFGSDATGTSGDHAPPAWTDAHAAAIPPVLFDMLDQILWHPRLTGLKGLALEVDTKPEALIADEFAHFTQRYATVFPLAKRETGASRDRGDPVFEPELVTPAIRRTVGEAYDRYARVVAGLAEPEGAVWSHYPGCREGLALYQSFYLPYEILHWGGELEAMFPESCRRLKERGVPIARLVRFWFRQPRPLSASYDFFLLKIDRFLEFVHEEMPEGDDLAEREAEELRQAYHAANQPTVRTASGLI
ncbi:MAG: multinuclear nonheme iron-dependent oxidase [Nitrospiraceae bacterium]